MLAAVVAASAAVAQGSGPAHLSDGFPLPSSIAFSEWRQVARTDSYSEFRQVFPSAVASRFPANNTVELQVFLPSDAVGSPPVAILLHFWGATDNALERDLAVELASRGIASVVMPLPYHLTRTPAGYRSGELAIQPDPEELKQTMRQSVADVQRTVDWIQSRREFAGSSIGVTGVSLGAIVSSLVFAVEPRIKSASFLLGGADLAHILMHSSRTVTQRRILESQGWTEDKLREALRPIEPLAYLSPGDRRPTYLIEARNDTVVPPADADKLASALPNNTVLTLETGHYGGFLVKDRLIRSIAAFFDATLRGRPFSAPSKFYSPTIRFSLMADTQNGLQIGAGLDIWRSNDRSDIFATGFLTPTGPQAYLGFQLGKGVSLGAMFSRRGTSPGLVWSTIF